MTRILHVSAYYAPAFRYGGPPRSIHGLCAALRAGGADLQVFTTDADGPGRLPVEVTRADRYEAVPVRYFPRSWPATPIGSRQLTAALRRELASGTAGPSRGDGARGGTRPTTVHIHGLWNRVVWSAAREARRAGVPYVVSPRGMLQDAALAHRAWRKRAAFALIERQTIDGAALLHATSKAEAEALARLAGEHRVVLIPNGITIRPAVYTPPPSPVMAFVGRLHAIKRLDLLIDAFVRLRTRFPSAKLVVAGPDEHGLRGTLSARAGEAAPAIEWLGEVDEAARDRLLASATALVACSDSESFGMSVLEAMAAATPVVVTATCGWGELAREQAGLVVEQTPAAIADAVACLAADAPHAVAMGARGRALAERRYAWPEVAAAFVREYERLALATVAVR